MDNYRIESLSHRSAFVIVISLNHGGCTAFRTRWAGGAVWGAWCVNSRFHLNFHLHSDQKTKTSALRFYSIPWVSSPLPSRCKARDPKNRASLMKTILYSLPLWMTDREHGDTFKDYSQRGRNLKPLANKLAHNSPRSESHWKLSSYISTRVVIIFFSGLYSTGPPDRLRTWPLVAWCSHMTSVLHAFWMRIIIYCGDSPEIRTTVINREPCKLLF